MSTSYKNQPQQLFDDAYHVVSTLGRGQNAIVYKARDVTNSSSDESNVALKVVFKDGHSKGAFQRLKREALSLLATRHKNVIRMHDYKAQPDYCYLVLEFASNGSLDGLLQRSPAGLPWQQAINIMKQVLAGVSSVHRAGIVHRDIKPENILITEDGIVKIADFSLASFPHEDSIAGSVDQVTGTLDYLAPETLQNSETSFSSDIFAVGVTFFRLLTGEFPFPSESIATHAQWKTSGKHYPLSQFVDIPTVGFEVLIGKALASSPQARFRSVEEFLSELELLERNLFGDDQQSVLDTSTPSTGRKVLKPLVASRENRFEEQHVFFRRFQNEIEEGSSALVSVEASNVGPLAPLLNVSYRMFDRYLSSMPRRIVFMLLVFLSLWGTYKIVSSSSTEAVDSYGLPTQIWLTKANRVLQALQPFLEDESHFGVMKSFADSQRDDAIYFKKSKDDLYVFGVGLPGFQETYYTYADLAAAKELHVSGPAGDLVFRIEGKSDDLLHIWGTYSADGNSVQGKWILW